MNESEDQPTTASQNQPDDNTRPASWTEDNTGVLDPGALDIIRRITRVLPSPPER